MGLFRTMLDGDREVVAVSAFDAQTAAEERAEQAFNEESRDRARVYVEDEDGEVLAFEVEVEMVPSFDATESDDAVPAEVVRAFETTRKEGTR
jgi:hypothetical protein